MSGKINEAENASAGFAERSDGEIKDKQVYNAENIDEVDGGAEETAYSGENAYGRNGAGYNDDVNNINNGSSYNNKKKKDNKPKKFFNINRKYADICMYILLLVFFGTVIYMLINNWSGTKAFICNLAGVLSPFFAALLIAYFVSPIVGKFEGIIQKYITKGKHKKLVRALSMVLAYITVIGFIIIAFVFVIPQIGESISELASSLPVVYGHLVSWLRKLHQKYPVINVNLITERLNEMIPEIVDFGTNIVGNVIPMVFSVSVSIARSIINVFLAVMISIYMINGKEKFRYQAKRFVYAVFDEYKGDVICSTLRECNDIFSAFLISKAVDSFIIGCICCVLMNILGLPYPMLISVIVGITNMIPYFGPFIGAVPGVIIYLCTSPKDAVIFAVMILVLQQFDGLVLGPRLLGQSTGLNPMWVIFAITVGGAYFGVLGMFIGVPVVAVIGFLADKFIKYKLKGKNIKALQGFK